MVTKVVSLLQRWIELVPLLAPCVLKPLLRFVTELTIRDKVFYTGLTGLPVPMKVVGHFDKDMSIWSIIKMVGGPSIIDAPWAPFPLVSRVSIHPHHLRKSLPTSPVMRVVAALAAASPHRSPPWRSLQTSPVKRVITDNLLIWRFVLNKQQLNKEMLACCSGCDAHGALGIPEKTRVV